MKVFLVDDEIVIREGIRESFPWDRTPYTLVGEAPDGEMALPMIRDTNPDIVITDIKMPFMDGLELCRSLRSRMPWIGIIVLSGYDEFEYARQCIQLGVREYLLKPVSSADLKEALDKVSLQMQEERKSMAHASSLRARMGSDDKLVKEKLVGSLFYGRGGQGGCGQRGQTAFRHGMPPAGPLLCRSRRGIRAGGKRPGGRRYFYGYFRRKSSGLSRQSRNKASDHRKDQ